MSSIGVCPLRETEEDRESHDGRKETGCPVGPGPPSAAKTTAADVYGKGLPSTAAGATRDYGG